MVTTLALFALFSIGSAVCTGSDTNPCIEGGFIGICNKTNTTCTLNAECLADVKDGTSCGQPTMKGRCKEPTSGVHRCEPIHVLCAGATATKADHCITGAGLIGKCSGTAVSSPSSQTCTLTECTQSESNAVEKCGAKYEGRCNADKKCEFSESVKVEYHIKANKPAEEANQTVGNSLFAETYTAALGTEMGYTVAETKLYCPTDAATTGKTTPDASNNIGEGTLSCSQEADGKCDLICPENYAAESHTKQCSAGGKWTGAVGVCKQSCPVKPANGAWETNDQGDLTGKFVIKESVHGLVDAVITCDNVLDKTKCKLVCGPVKTHTVDVVTEFSCAVNSTNGAPGTWGVPSGKSLGSCQEFSTVSASAEVTLKHTDNHDNVIALKDEAFNKKFQDAVADTVGVLPENVIITKIENVPFRKGRRLNEKSVKVHYTVRVAKGGPEGRLLRGIS